MNDSQSFLLNAKLHLLQTQQYFMEQYNDSEIIQQIDEALLAVERALQNSAKQSTTQNLGT